MNIETVRKKLLVRWEKERPKETPVLFVNIGGKEIAIKDESKNVTGTYKAKHGWMMGLDFIKNRFPRKFVYFLGSTGNAGLADFEFADKLNHILKEEFGKELVLVANFFPLHYDTKDLGPDSFGRNINGKSFREKMQKFSSGRLIQVDFKEKYWFGQHCLDKMNELGIKVNDSNCMDITEGFKPTYNQVMEEFVRQIKDKFGKIPKTLAIVQFGAGMLHDDSKEVAKGLPITFLAVSSGNPDTIADKICDSSESWQESLFDLREKGFTKSRNTGDRIFHVTEHEIFEALKQFNRLGIESEPSGAAGMAIIPRIKEIFRESFELIAIINTGNGIKNSIN